MFRETSAQHFAVPSGDYDAAVAKNPSLVHVRSFRNDATARVWRGPSLCRAHGRGAARAVATTASAAATATTVIAATAETTATEPTLSHHQEPLSTTPAISSTRAAAATNGSVTGTTGGTGYASDGVVWGWRNAMLVEELHAGGHRAVHVQPYGALTAERWDFHESTVCISCFEPAPHHRWFWRV